MSDELRTEDVGTYEMLWDCRACGTDKLLGLTHRHCPACGSPQDPEARYFPSDAEKVKVEDHPLAGRDVECPACNTANASTANNCGGCGYPLGTDAKQVVVREDIVLDQGQAFAGETGTDARDAKRAREAAQRAELRGEAPPTPAAKADAGKRSGKKKLIFILAGIAALIVTLIVIFSLDKEVEIEASGHTWSRTIEIEQYGEVRESAWCDSVPARAKVSSRTREVRSKKKVPDGEVCKTRKKDNGNGTFKEVKECTPKYREEPVYDDRCAYRIDKWHRDREVSASGKGIEPEPKWPEVELAKTGTGNCRGCEREGRREETYIVTFSYDGETDECEFSYDKWRSISDGESFSAKAGRVTGNLDCDSLAH